MNKAGAGNVIGSNIRDLRIKRGISQDRLSKLADLSLNTIVKIEAGKNVNPTIITLSKIAKSFKVRVDDLIKAALICILISTSWFHSALAGDAFKPDTKLDYKEKERLITIPEGIGIVLKDSRLIKISGFDKDFAFEDSLKERSGLLPQINASITQSFLRHQPAAKFDSLIVSTADKSSLSYSLDIYQTLFDFGKSLFNYKASRDIFDSSKEKLEAVKKLAVLEFIENYFDTLQAEKMVQVAEKEVESLSSYLSDVEHMYEQGAAVKSDILAAKVKLADGKQRLITANNARMLALAKLNNILALPLRSKIGVKDINMSPPNIPETEGAWKIAQAQRPEIAIVNDLINASSMRQKAKITSHLPVVYAETGYTYTQNRFVTPQDNAFINLGAKIDIFDGLKSDSDFLKERNIHRQLLSEKDKLIEDIKLEIEDSYYGIKDAIEKVSVSKDVLEQAEENVRVTRAKYNEGSAISTEVLESVALRTGAQTNYFSADYELKRYYARLMYSMGIDLALLYERMEDKDEHAKP